MYEFLYENSLATLSGTFTFQRERERESDYVYNKWSNNLLICTRMQEIVCKNDDRSNRKAAIKEEVERARINWQFISAMSKTKFKSSSTLQVLVQNFVSSGSLSPFEISIFKRFFGFSFNFNNDVQTNKQINIIICVQFSYTL